MKNQTMPDGMEGQQEDREIYYMAKVNGQKGLVGQRITKEQSDALRALHKKEDELGADIFREACNKIVPHLCEYCGRLMTFMKDETPAYYECRDCKSPRNPKNKKAIEDTYVVAEVRRVCEKYLDLNQAVPLSQIVDDVLKAHPIVAFEEAPFYKECAVMCIHAILNSILRPFEKAPIEELIQELERRNG